ncbi:MAG: serine/threonine protein kinase, partial [Planctomycetota bacterium]
MAQNAMQGRILVGRYRLGRALGTGAHGTVYLAEDLGRGGRRVAVKLVEGVVGAGELSESAGTALQWFRHPNWADVLDWGRCGEYDWFQALEFVDGIGLDTLEGPQDVELIWRLLEDGARVLGALHHRGLIHYDVTPGNWLMERRPGGPNFVLTDGGLAHLGPVLGVARGTPMYMAPETTEDRQHDHRADLYSLGLVAFRLATGRDPVEGGAGEVLGRRRREQAPRASTLREGLPKALDDLLASLLSRDPSRRPETGMDLLARVAAGTGRKIPELLPKEAYAAADGGALVGREDDLRRFRRTCTTLAGLLPDAGEQDRPPPSAPLTDPVLLVTGPSGIGGTRTVRQMAAAARDLEVPLLLLAGRDGAPDAGRPLQGLLDGLAALAHEDRNMSPPRRDEKRMSSAEERAFAQQRLTEQFIRMVLAAARRTPFVLLVEDFGELPRSAQGAVRALSRHLSSRSEHGQGVNPPPVMLLVDMGESDAEPLLIADAEDPSQPLMNLEALDAEAGVDLCAARFPGLVLAEQDVGRLHAMTGGLPGVAVGILAEAVRRGDLTQDAGRWTWDTKALDAYEVQSRLPPVHQVALDEANEEFRALLRDLAIVERPLRSAVAASLWLGRSRGPFPRSPLLAEQSRNGHRTVTLVSGAVRRAVLAGTGAEDRRTHASALLAALGDEGAADSLVDRARLQLELGQPEEALAVLDAEAETLPTEDRLRIQPLLKRAVDAGPALLEDPAQRARLAPLLEFGAEAVDLAKQLAPRFSTSGEEIRSVLLVAQVLENGQAQQEAEALLEAHAESPRASLIDRAATQAQRARLAFNRKQYGASAEATSELRELLRELGPDRRRQPGLRAAYLVASARNAFIRGDAAQALRALRAARVAARQSRDRPLHAQILNNLGIALVQNRETQAAMRFFERSLRLKLAIGDVS